MSPSLHTSYILALDNISVVDVRASGVNVTLYLGPWILHGKIFCHRV